MADETPYEIMGGEQSVRALADRFYDLIEQDSRFAGLRSIHEEDLTAIRANLTSFLSGWLGGPRDWFGRGKCVMSLHSGLAIDRALARQRADAMQQAIMEHPDLDARFREQMSEALARVANAMVNRAQTPAETAAALAASLHSSAPVQCRYAFFSIERNCT